MIQANGITRLALAGKRKRILGLCLFAGLFIASGLAARLLTGDGGHAEVGDLFLIGGYPLVSALLLMGWLLGRFPVIAALVLLAGVISDDRHDGTMRLLAVRPTSRIAVYARRVIVLLATAFVISAIVMPLFDFIMLGEWTGNGVFAFIFANVMVYGGLVTLLSVFTRGDAWIALGLAIAAMIWHALQRGQALAQAPPGVREVVAFILPPQGALFAIESAFADSGPMPWGAVAYCAIYGLVALVAAAMVLAEREH